MRERLNARAAWGGLLVRTTAERHVTSPQTPKPRGGASAPAERVFALPSRSDSFGLVLLEAWANGVPNLAYRAGGIADVIRHDQDGLLVPCGDISALTCALQRLAEDAGVRQRLAMSGKARLACDFSWEDKLSLVRQRYTEMDNSFSARRTPCER